ncbi:unnamed protein product [Leptosia nina]|uniref:TOG domain-containing protein n=1 Tax=Leptosia nina TaxID=320188 RepID=A0AAV1JV11_9NEOP
MADTEVLKKLKDVPFRIQSSSIKERREVIEEIKDVLGSPGITEPAVRFICRILILTLHRYRDSSSQSYVKSLLSFLAINHQQWTFKNLVPLLLEISEQLRNTATSKSIAQTGLYALRWTTVLVENCIKADKDEVDYIPLVLCQSNLLAVVTAYGEKRYSEKAYIMLHTSWNAIEIEKLQKWIDVLLLQASDSGPHLCVAFSALCRHLKEISKQELILQHKGKMLESFTKSLISVKIRPNPNYIHGCSDVLHLLLATDIKETLLPALHKAMLRSPETIIEAVGVVVDNLNIQLDALAVDIGKGLIVNTHSRDEWTRSAASEALSRVARRCSALAASKTLLTAAIAEYNGASGKLTSSEDKIAVLNAVGTLSEVGVSDEDFAALLDEVITQMCRMIEAESHERTLCVALEVLHRWARRSNAHLPEKILQMYKKNLPAKSTTQAVRIAYASMVSRLVVVRGASPAQAETLKSMLLPIVDKAIQQPLQHLIVSEGICAMVSLVKLDARQELLSKPPIWNALMHADKHILLHDRLLSVAQDDVLIQVVLLCRSVLENYQSVASDKNAPVFKAFILVLLSPVKLVRTAAIQEVKALLAKEDRALLARYLIQRLNAILEEGKIFHVKEKTPPEEKPEVTGKIILDCVQALCFFRDYSKEDSAALAIDALPSCHHPLAAAINKWAWVKLVRYLRHEPRKLVAIHSNNLKNTYINGYTPTETASNVVSTLAWCNSESLGGAALAAALNALGDPEMLRVNRDEYFTYLTPPSDLYDKSVIPGNEDNKEMNLKRESKAYSYKEQLEELQLRRELEEKRRKEGRIKEVPLSAKQKEAIKVQMAKEAAIRDRLTALNSRVVNAAQLVEAVQRGSPNAICIWARRLVPAVLDGLRSPLAAPTLLQTYWHLKRAMLPQHSILAEHVARVTIRLHKPQCDLDPSWEEEDLAKATGRIIHLLNEATAGMKANKVNHFTAPGFCYVFPLLQKGLTCGATRTNESMVVDGLAVITHHASLRGESGSDGDASRDLLYPTLFPIDHMFRLLIDLIGSSSGRVAAACTVALLETAQCAARAPITQEDVNCLLAALQSPAEVVRDAGLRALGCVLERLPPFLEQEETALDLTKRLYIATFDTSEDNMKLAQDLWSSLPRADGWITEAEIEIMNLLLKEIQHPSEPVQRAAASALAALVSRAQRQECAADQVLQRLHQVYNEKLPLIPAKLDQFGHETEAAVDNWGSRRGVALALRALASCLRADIVPHAMSFFVQKSLGDRHEVVRSDMLIAAMAVVDIHGKDTLSTQLPVFEKFLDNAPKSGGYDAVRQSVVLLVGSLARHLEPTDARVKPITLRLVAALSTPSQQVQEAVSNCLPHLVTSPALEGEIPTIMNKLMKQLLTAEKYGDRKGAAYGIAGIIKGLGILSLKQLDVMGKLTEAIQEKKNYKYREGALFGFEMLCYKLGRLFEPYIVHVLPHLLLCFGDSSQYVRAAADDTAKLIMSKLSAHGVKLVLPALLQALYDDNWRTKAGSIELLGAMAYCAPKQLSSCLPSIVPKLIEVLSDSHMRVQQAAAEALKVIGSVIRNPEIQAIVPVLLQALQDPSNKTSACLQTLLDTKFVHFIDAPSLALIMPVVQRAFLDRSTETRKMAAQIIGNMYSLTDQKDLMPYLPNIIPGLKSSLLDPVPEVRSVSARALGAMVKGMGESSFEELLPWLMHTLTSESSSVDRSGAAQGLSEVVAGLGVHKLHKIMPDIIATAERTDIAPHVKDGYIMMFIYMPGAFTDEFTPYIGQIINPILKALADENEYVRETALKAGQRIVNLYAESAITLLLPELENGLFDDNWRIRYSSVQLLGDLLYRISGVSGKMSTETASEDDNFGTEHSHKAIINALGPDRRNRVLAGLYMGRSDVALMVRQAALHVWKVVVTNTPKTLREILPTLFSLLLGCLASTSYDKRQVAARTLGDLVRKIPSVSDVRVGTVNLAAKAGYEVEEHRVTTADGYILTMFRIPGDNSPPTLLMHGILDSSDTWLLRENDSLAVALANRGHDVWLGNCRGNFYSKDHVNITRENNPKDFWNFSFHELGYYDLPAMIDYILNHTGAQKVNAVGHSQGTTIFFVMAALRPEYNKKVNVLVALAPIAYLSNVSPPLSILVKIAPELIEANRLLQQHYIVGDSPSGKLLKSICLNPIYGYVVCAYGLVFPVAGSDEEEYTSSIHYEAFKYYPENVSLKSLDHFDQVSLRKQFAQYDYGALKNLKFYGQSEPPAYDLGRVVMDVALVCGRNDKISTLADVATLERALPNVIQYTELKPEKANHLDFLGERVLPEIVPILERGLRSDRADQRQGVCIGLGEILASTSRDAVLSFADGLVPTVRTALCDELPEVRMAAARTFDSLHATIGNKALDDILPPMLEALQHPDHAVADATLDGLRQIMAIKSRAVLPYLVPVLTGGSGGKADTRALSALAAAAGNALARHLPRILPALLASLRAARGTPHEAKELDHCRDALLPVTDEAGVRCIIDTLLECVRTDEGEKRRAGSALLCAFVTHTRADLSQHVGALLRGLLLLFADQDREMLQMAWEALTALTRTLDAERLLSHVSDVRQAVRFAAADVKGDLLPGFCLPKGIAPVLPLFREAILNGLPEDKENAALMLGEVIRLTSAPALHSSVVHITGPLIRILGDRFNASVKAAVLETLGLLLSKVGVMLKQFLPQLQTTFLKSLSDPNRNVRIKAGVALSQLVLIHSRADPLFVELHNGIKNTDDPAIRETMLQALRSIITGGGDKMSEQHALAVLSTLTSPALLAHPDDPPRAAVGGCLGALLHCLPAAHRDAALLHHILGGNTPSALSDDWLLQHGRSCALFVALKETPEHVYRDQFEDKVEKALLGYLASDKTPIACNGIRGMGYLLRYLIQQSRTLPQNIISQFVRSMNHSSNDVKQLMARASVVLARDGLVPSGVGVDLLRALLPALVNGTKEKNTYVRANSELALRAVLRLPHDEQHYQQCMSLLEEGGREALADVVARVLRRSVTEGREEELDCTLLT